MPWKRRHCGEPCSAQMRRAEARKLNTALQNCKTEGSTLDVPARCASSAHVGLEQHRLIIWEGALQSGACCNIEQLWAQRLPRQGFRGSAAPHNARFSEPSPTLLIRAHSALAETWPGIFCSSECFFIRTFARRFGAECNHDDRFRRGLAADGR